MADDPEKRVQLKAAIQVANESLRAAASAEWIARRRFMNASRGGKLVLPEVLEPSETQIIYARAMAKLDDIAQHDPDPRWSTKALEQIQSFQLEEMRIRAGLDAKHPIVEAAQPAQPAPVDNLTPEEKTAFVRAHLKVAR